MPKMLWFKSQFKKGDGKVNKQSTTAVDEESVHSLTVTTTKTTRHFHQNPDHPWKYYKNVARRELFELMERNEEMRKPSQSSSESVHTSDTVSSLSISLEEELTRIQIAQDGQELEETAEEDLEQWVLVPECITRVPFQTETTLNFCVGTERVKQRFSDYSPADVHSLLSQRKKCFSGELYLPWSDCGLTPTPSNSPRQKE